MKISKRAGGVPSAEQLCKTVPRAVSERTLEAFASSLFEAIDSPRSLACYILLRNREYAQLVSLEIDANLYESASAFADDYLATKFLSKYPGFVHSDLDPEGVAEASFIRWEEQCKATNKRFRQLSDDPSKRDPLMWSILLSAKRKIIRVLGNVDLEALSRSFAWGPGATTGTKGNHTSAYVKFGSRLDVTSNCFVMGTAVVNSIPAWVNCQLQTDEFPSVSARILGSCFNVVRGNEVVFVPKNAKTHRVIAKEPTVNQYLQKGIGSTMRGLLERNAGIHLREQTINQHLAYLGSRDNSLATIDLSGASDTISKELVRFLLPESWFSLLNATRSPSGRLPNGDWIAYEKFSSMGNAFTFELESLIFWALCEGCLDHLGGDRTLHVYGDDIVIPASAYDLVAQVIDYCGFTVNESKSFHSGPFRESCGKDYFNGYDVRPIFQKEEISNAESILKLANRLRRYAHSRNLGYGCDARFLDAWTDILDRLPKALRDLKIPDGVGDGGVVSNFDEACPSTPGRGWEGYQYRALVRTPVKVPMRDIHAGYTAVLSALGCGSSEDREFVSETWTGNGKFPVQIADLPEVLETLPLRGLHSLRRRTTVMVARLHTHRWYDFGPWL